MSISGDPWISGITESGWQKLDGVFTSQLSMISLSKDRLDYFGLGTNKACSHKWFNGAWGGYESFGGVFTSHITSVFWGVYSSASFFLF